MNILYFDKPFNGNTPKSKVVADLYGCLSLLLFRANARSILVCDVLKYRPNFPKRSKPGYHFNSKESLFTL